MPYFWGYSCKTLAHFRKTSPERGRTPNRWNATRKRTEKARNEPQKGEANHEPKPSPPRQQERRRTGTERASQGRPTDGQNESPRGTKGESKPNTPRKTDREHNTRTHRDRPHQQDRQRTQGKTTTPKIWGGFPFLLRACTLTYSRTTDRPREATDRTPTENEPRTGDTL